MVENVVAIWISVLQKYMTIITLLLFPVSYQSSPTQHIGREVVLCSRHSRCFISHLVHVISEV